MEKTTSFILSHFATCATGWLEITLLDDAYKDDEQNRRAPITAWLQMEGLADRLPTVLERAQARNDDGWGVYVGVTTRREKQKAGRRGGKANALHAPGLWLDIDWGYERIVEAYDTLQAFTLPPTTIIATGGGVQAWWEFIDPVDVSNENKRKSLERVLKGLARVLRGDTAVADVARIMRLPGFRNMKPTRNGFMATALSELGPVYNALQFVSYAEFAEPPTKYQRRAAPVRHNGNSEKPVMTHMARQFLESGAAKGNRHTMLIHTAYQMKAKGYTRAECEEQAGGAAAGCGLPDGEIEKVIGHVYAK